MFDSEEEISCYHDLVLAEYNALEDAAFSFETGVSRLSNSKVEEICAKHGIEKSELQESGILIAYPDGSYRTMHMDIVYRAVNARAAAWSNKIPLEFKLVRPTEELIPSFEEKDVQDLAAFLKLEPSLKVMLIDALRDSGYGRLAHHQVYYLRGILGRNDKCNLLVSPTASGKSLIFYVAVLTAVLSRPEERGTRAIIVYPRKALASDQLQKFMKVAYALNRRLRDAGKDQITIGIDDGDTPRSSSSDDVMKRKIFRGLRCAEPGCTGSLRYTRIGSGCSVTCDKCGKTYGELLPTKSEIWESHPSIIFTNLAALNRRLMMKASQPIVGPSVRWVVLDEAHVYREEVGGHARWLLRRILSRSELLTKGDIRFIISSATIHNPKGFVSRLLGISDSVYYEEYPRVLAASKETKKKLTINLIVAPNPLRSAESLAEELSLLLGVWGYSHNRKSIVFIDNVSEVERMKDFIVNDIITGRQAQNDHIDASRTPSVSNPSESFSWIGLSKGQTNIDSAEFSKLYSHHFAELNPDERAQVEESFKARKSGVLFATSTLELGLDIGNIAAIIQYKIPLTAESYVQRIGRAGRSNEVGRVALGFLVLTNAPSQIRYVLESEYKRLLEPQVEIPIAYQNEEIRKQHTIFSILDYEAARNNSTFLDFVTEVKPYWFTLRDAMDSLKGIIADARNNMKILREYYAMISGNDSKMNILDDTLDQISKKVEFGLDSYCRLPGMDIDESMAKLRQAENAILETIKEIARVLHNAKRIGETLSQKELTEYESTIAKLQDSLTSVLAEREKVRS